MPHISKMDEFFGKVPKGGRGGHFQSKNLYCKIWTFKKGFFSMKMIQKGLFRVCFHPITMLNICTTCISWEIGSYNTQQSLHMNVRTFVAILSRNPHYNFPKMRGGVKGRLELFLKFVRFGCARHPLGFGAKKGRSSILIQLRVRHRGVGGSSNCRPIS